MECDGCDWNGEETSLAASATRCVRARAHTRPPAAYSGTKRCNCDCLTSREKAEVIFSIARLPIQYATMYLLKTNKKTNQIS